MTAICLAVVIRTVASLAAAPEAPAAPTDACSTPGVVVLSDAPNDATDGLASHELESVSIAEPPVGLNVRQLVFTIKMKNLLTLTNNTAWPVFFTTPSGSYYVDMQTDPAGAVSFKYGTGPSNGRVPYGDADSGSTYDAATGTITIKISNSKLGNIARGQQITKIYSRITVDGGAVLVYPDSAPNTDPVNSTASYTLVGNDFCNGNIAPTASLQATPTTGTAPLSVNFDASGSTDPDSAIATYSFDFGDGSPLVTQAMPTTSHIYPNTGVYTASVVVTDTGGATSYNNATVTIVVASSAPPPRYQVFTPPAEMLARGFGTDAGEPSIGVNWNTGRVFFQSGLTTARVTFDDSCPSTPRAIWEDKSPPTSATSLDPILYTDSFTGRTIVSQLAGTSSLASYTDNDGDLWVPSEGGSIGTSGIDHQTIGGGPYHAPAPAGVIYQHAIYYCSQDAGDASCALSPDGGRTFGPAIPMYNVNQCGGLHGHVKVGTDGTVYVPNKKCDPTAPLAYTTQSLLISKNNGVTWTKSNIPGSLAAGSDPSVAIGRGDVVPGGRVYFGYADGDKKAKVAVSDDQGTTWPAAKIKDVGAALGIKNVVFSTMVAGDDDRAAFAFVGTTSTGDLTSADFHGIWHLYVATTYDGGENWTTVDVTPNDPVQRGPIWLGGGSVAYRNLLDFNDATVDKDGRLLIAFADGCVGPCVQSPPSPNVNGNSYSQVASIVRQTGGRGLFAQFDPPATVPGAPYLTVTRDGSTAHLIWSLSDDGGSPVTGYKVYRRTPVGPETLLTAVSPTTLRFDDTTADPNVLYYYRVGAVTTMGESCPGNQVLAMPTGNSCTGLRVVQDPAGDQKGNPADPDLDIRSISISEPFDETAADKLVFRMKVGSLCNLLPNRQWRIIWNFPVKAPNISASLWGGRYYVGMNTDNSGAVSYEYGTVTTANSAVPANTNTPNRIGAADSGSYNPDGTITILLAKSKVGNPVPGDMLGLITGRTFSGQGTQTVGAQSALDTTSTLNGYEIVGSTFCQGFVPPAATITKPIVGDFDSDTLTDLAVYRPSEGNWYFSNSFGSQGVRQWGLASDKITPGDFDGDRRTDLAIFRPDEGNWYIINSLNNTVRVQGWGQNGDKPVAADYDGDGYTDLAVFRPSEGNWYIQHSSGCSALVQGWGNSTDQPVPADYDGDGKADLAVFRPDEGNWYIIRSTGGTTVQGWGQGGDIPVPGDYDGDGKADLAVFRPSDGNWYIVKSGGGTLLLNWGGMGDNPVQGDYDGDGKTDIAIFRQSEGNWYIIKSSGGTSIQFLGMSGDIPVPLAYSPY